jgi:NTE family protein
MSKSRPSLRSVAPAARVDVPLNVLVLQGGGALGAYQAGAFQALAESDRHPQWVAGISIGAINAALIAGNPPHRRVERLTAFWDGVTRGIPSSAWALADGPLRAWANECAAAWGAAFGLPGFFRPHAGLTPWAGAAVGPSLYDTEPLRRTLLELVDFDRLNDGSMRLSVGAVDVATGNFEYFDNRQRRIGPEHIMASGALPPGFPAVTVDGRAYWDGGLVSNTPLRHVIENLAAPAATVFQVDLFSARGAVPSTLAQVAEREKDIRFSSRTRAVTDLLRERHEANRRLRAVAAMLPAAQRDSPQVREWLASAQDATIDLVHLIHRHRRAETQSKDYEFSPTSMREHWQLGLRDMGHSLRRLDAAGAPVERGGFRVFDFQREAHRDAVATEREGALS